MGAAYPEFQRSSASRLIPRLEESSLSACWDFAAILAVPKRYEGAVPAFDSDDETHSKHNEFWKT
jgi:hypothetical protein